MAARPKRRAPAPPPAFRGPPVRPVEHPEGPCACGFPWTSFGLGPPLLETQIWLCGACWLIHPTTTDRRDEALDRIAAMTLEGIEDE